jgi:hypothetical protein
MNDTQLLAAYRFALAALIDGSKGPGDIVADTGMLPDEALAVWIIGSHAIAHSENSDRSAAKQLSSECPGTLRVAL